MHLKTNTKSNVIKRKSKLIPHLILAFIILLLISIISIFVIRYFNLPTRNNTSVKYIYSKWNEHDYKSVYDTCNTILQNQAFNNTALTFKGYAGFYLAVSQTDSSIARDYLDEAIINMRLAIQSAKKSLLPQLYYMLGKTYFYKNTLSSYYYYSDLAIEYLLKAQNLGYSADDIYEYLGLSYASLGMTKDSISAFTEALLVRESDSLLLSIAEQYNKNAQYSAAKQYLHIVIQNSNDENLVLKSKLLLGQIYISEKNYSDAEKEFQTILQKNENSADAYYGLGVIYENQGDLIKARAEWRRALRIQVNHPDALKKISEYK